MGIALSTHLTIARRNPTTSGCRVRICAGTTSRPRVTRRTMSYRAPSGSAMKSVLPATRQAAGVPSAWSQSSQSTHARPRRWCDAGSLGRQCVTADQKAGDEGAKSVPVAVAVAVAGNPTKPDRPALSRIRPTDFNVSDGQAGRPPLQCPPNRFETLIAMIVGPASRRPIRALVDPRRAARQSSAALVYGAMWSRVFPSNTCAIGISPRSESPKSGATTLRTRDDPIRT